MAKDIGALPSQTIRAMIAAGFIRGADEANIRPASLDLTISSEIYRVEGIFQPRPGENIRSVLDIVGATPHDPIYPLERRVTYLAKFKESLALPPDIYAYCNPKSSTGRNDVQVRVVADGVPRYDAAAPAGFGGDLWVVIEPKSFPVRIQPGDTLSQIRFFNHDTRFDELELQIAFERDKLLWSKEEQPFAYRDLKISDNDGSIILTLDLDGDVVGWECLGSSRVFDFSKANYYTPTDFFRPIRVGDGRVHLTQGGFYIFRTKERVRVPLHLACEMVAMDIRSGEFRTHYAGFVDPGWGWGQSGEGRGRSLVLELRPFEDLLLRDNQPVAKVHFEKMTEVPEVGYDSLEGSHYTIEPATPRLSKHFRSA